MIPPCPTCNGTGRVHETGPLYRTVYKDCPEAGPTLLNRYGNPVHADGDRLVRWCRAHWRPQADCWGISVLVGSCRSVWATVQTWEEAKGD